MNITLENGKKPNFRLNFGPVGPILGLKNVLSWVLPLLNVRHCHKLSLCAILGKTYNPNSTKWRNTLFWAWFRPIGPNFWLPNFFFKSLALSVTRYDDQLLLCKILEKTNDPIFIKFSDGRTDRRTRVISVITLSDRRRVSNSVLWKKKKNWHPSSILQNLINLTKTNIQSLSACKKLAQFFNPSLRYSEF